MAKIPGIEVAAVEKVDEALERCCKFNSIAGENMEQAVIDEGRLKEIFKLALFKVFEE